LVAAAAGTTFAGWPVIAVAAGGLLLLLGIGGWALARRADVVVADSASFQDALAIWHPVIYGQRSTPRSVKRYLNHVRYFAMCQRRHRPEPTPEDRLAGLWRAARNRRRGGDRPPEVRLKPGSIPEDALVAVGAVRYFHAEWMRDDAAWASLQSGQPPPPAGADGDGDATADPEVLRDQLEAALKAHHDKFKKNPFTNAYRAKLLELYPAARPDASADADGARPRNQNGPTEA
jgi:hypothetical protein